MKFVYGKQDLLTRQRAEETCWLMTNGLGGFASTSAAFSVTRNDHSILMGARTAPNDRVNLVHRLAEQLTLGDKKMDLSTQAFADGKKEEDGYRRLSSFVWEYVSVWTYDAEGVRVTRTCAMGYEENVTALCYQVENRSETACTLTITPFLQMAPKGTALREKWVSVMENGKISANDLCVYVKTDALLRETETVWETLAYDDDAKDGRPAWGMAGSCCTITKTVEPGAAAEFELIFSASPITACGREILENHILRQKQLEEAAPFRDPVAKQLSRAAADYVSYRQSTGGKTILAGYPFFGDWGRDTMIALPGCTLARQDYETAKSILRTFLAYEKDGLVPNLFPEGESLPQYNTVDAALLLINSIWLYYEKTGDLSFVREAMPVMERIAAAYQSGTHHGIHMDADGLICAGQGMDQVTWMDVCVEGILPTPRHGKPVEINAYWYNALRILAKFSELMDKDGTAYELLSEKVKDSFVQAFWLEKEGYLKDVVSGTKADQQIRCNQIWAVTMPFAMLDREKERRVVDTVYRHLYTPCGLRTLSPEDEEFHGTYGGPQKERDLAYHQGTVWPFPMGGYYLAYLKVNDYSEAACAVVRQQLEAVEGALREGCAGQLPEIYDGLVPGRSQGCFAQAWSVGEILRVYEALEKGAKG